jgi:hypothetical protein
MLSKAFNMPMLSQQQQDQQSRRQAGLSSAPDTHVKVSFTCNRSIIRIGDILWHFVNVG